MFTSQYRKIHFNEEQKKTYAWHYVVDNVNNNYPRLICFKVGKFNVWKNNEHNM